jgi:hypothetical protein
MLPVTRPFASLIPTSFAAHSIATHTHPFTMTYSTRGKDLRANPPPGCGSLETNGLLRMRSQIRCSDAHSPHSR